MIDSRIVEANSQTNANLDALRNHTKIPFPDADINAARRNLIGGISETIAKKNPPGTSITGPVSNPLNRAEAVRIFISEAFCPN